MAGKKIDFAAINRAALGQFESLLGEWLPDGEPSGSEYRAINPTRGDSKKGSFSINIRKGVWQDFATDDAGSDPISLYAYLFCNDDQGAAAKELGELLGIEAPNTPREKKAKAPYNRQPRQGDKPAEPNKKPSNESLWHPIIPVPADAPERHKAHSVRGLPDTVWTYHGLDGAVLGHVYRFKSSDGGKEVLPLTWCRHEKTGQCEWRWMQWAVPRPLYGLERLTVADIDDPEHNSPVLLLEGEKCADAADIELAELACLTWSGGSKAVDKADWTPLAGRKVIIWPDCDSQREKKPKDAPDDFIPPFLPEDKQPGMVAARKIAEKLVELGCKVWVMAIPPVGTMKNGWDVADAIADGLTGLTLANYVRAKSKLFMGSAEAESAAKLLSTPVPASAGGGDSGDFPPDYPDYPDYPDPPDDTPNPDSAWYHALAKKARGGIEPCRSNVAKILRMHPKWRGVIGYNEFAHQIEKLLPTPWTAEPGVWDGADDSCLDEWLADDVDVLIKAMSTIAEGVSHAANAHKFHPVRQFLTGLAPWDGTSRLDCYLADITQAENTPFLRLAGRFFLIAMVARIFRPGCKFDYMLVLEGKQGQGKSSFFRILADPWFSETPFDIGTNEGNMAIQGVWLQEMAEMGMFSRSEDTAFKSFLAIVRDKFRRPYDRRPVEAPRVCLFGGTTNLDQYLKDQTGNRRIWPVRCAEVDTELLRDIREQLFAEALVAFNAGERFWPTPEEERLYFEPEQATRLSVDAWEELIQGYVNDPSEKLRNFYTALDLLINACKVEKSKIDEANRMTSRVGRIMQKIGWERVREPSGQFRRWGYVRPVAERIRKDIFTDPIKD
ncbi:VapE family protein [Methylomonas montana]|uniref:VapE domain-containing protein n=1 Tax=Methylomonas montana TaxID=3058963 RepID=UPI002659AEE5|nr:VapE domain-containing protein [Methylomonas montana]WKJ88773.1 VapE family protein [Methylomonas montana]